MSLIQIKNIGRIIVQKHNSFNNNKNILIKSRAFTHCCVFFIFLDFFLRAIFLGRFVHPLRIHRIYDQSNIVRLSNFMWTNLLIYFFSRSLSSFFHVTPKRCSQLTKDNDNRLLNVYTRRAREKNSESHCTLNWWQPIKHRYTNAPPDFNECIDQSFNRIEFHTQF